METPNHRPTAQSPTTADIGAENSGGLYELYDGEQHCGQAWIEFQGQKPPYNVMVAAEKMGITISDKQADNMIKPYDRDGDGAITMAEFTKIIRQQ